nr:MAG TPA: hypothetical protein [Caudoviricetes sp.]
MIPLSIKQILDEKSQKVKFYHTNSKIIIDTTQIAK